ncbi:MULTISPECIES: hypothetical protein [Polaribacter]|uniref:Uncharacterized protein n=1 Tax=Polaribacter marinaquae TaxID=1642819 RepID=A0ABZ2TUR9_9FLAO|nr:MULTISPECIES: hypothetical protein [unclassified Polaribacter]AQS95065.1 hypothetical protein BXQ17_13675 [Polaribacter sp. BM10]SHN00099.1 hypothetical protein SAMN05720268_1980 [Polaribacter sp. KT 15]
MENVFKYFEFSDFFKDESGSFSGNEICFTDLNETHFLIFEKEDSIYNLYVSKFSNKKEVGQKAPEILELVVQNYDKSKPEHRIALRQYLG